MSTNKNNPQDDFDTGIDVSTLTDAEKAIYEKLNKPMRDAWLKKTNSLAEERKSQESKLAALQQQHDAAAKQLADVQAWWQNEGQYLTKAEAREVLDEANVDPSGLMRELNTLKNQFTIASTKYDQTISKLTEQNNTLENMIRYQSDLFDIRMKHPEADPMRIIETAKEKGIHNLDLAYNMAYGEEKHQKAIDDAVSAAREEERAKVNAEQAIVDTKPSTTRYAPPEESKSYADASKSLLSEVRKTGGMPI